MAGDTTCANCGEEEQLQGERSGETITITCEACGLVWDRDLTPKCNSCGRTDVHKAFQSILEKSRGTQLSIQSLRVVYLCPACDAVLLADYIKSNSPLPPAELPVTPRD